MSQPKEMPWTVSQIQSFEACPLQYANMYEFKTIPYEESEEQAEGNRRHQQLNLRLAYKDGGIPLPAELWPLEPICKSLEQAGSVHAELPVSITRDLKATSYYSDDVWHRGKIDVVALAGNGTAIALDWKTGNPNYEKPFQLSVYALDLMIKFTDLQKVSVANVWFRNLKPEAVAKGAKALGTIHTYTREKDFQRIAVDVMTRHDNIVRARKAGVWPATPNPFCKGCKVMGCQYREEPRA